MTKRGWMLSVAVLLLALALCLSWTALDVRISTQPRLNRGARWRIAYCEGGDYYDYVLHLRGALNGLAALGWLAPLDSPEWRALETTQEIWAYAREHGGGQYVELLGDAFWSSEWDDALREKNRQACLARLTEGGDIDLILAMGTWAGKDLAVDGHDTPVIVLSTSDPVRAGIIQSAQHSGRPNVHAMCDPKRYERNLRTFHKLVDFQRLGLVYEDTVDGRLYGNVAIYRQVAAELGVELVERHITEVGVSTEEEVSALQAIYQELAPQIDALIFTALNAEDPEYMPFILQPLLENKVATWGQLGPAQVRRGVLLSVAEQDYDDVGLFYAQTIAHVFHGRRAGSLPQVFEDPKTLAINMETARRIGYIPPPGLLSAAEEVYQTIESE